MGIEMIYQFLLNVVSVAFGIALYKKLGDVYDDIRWKFKQRHQSRNDPWERW